MEKRKFCRFLLMALWLFIYDMHLVAAQDRPSTRYTLSAAGQLTNTGSYQLEYSLGQLADNRYDIGDSQFLQEGILRGSAEATTSNFEVQLIQSTLAPNPTDAVTYLNWEDGTGIAFIQIVDPLGRKVFHQDLDSHRSEVRLSLHQLGSGTYFLIGQDSIGRTVLRKHLIIQK